MRILERLRRFQSRLGVRFTALFASILIIFTIQFTAYNIMVSGRAIHDELERHVSYVGRFAADLVADDLRNLKLNELSEIMQGFAARSDVVYARLLDSHRRVVTDGVGATIPFSAVSADDLFDAADASGTLRI